MELNAAVQPAIARCSKHFKRRVASICALSNFYLAAQNTIYLVEAGYDRVVLW